MAVDQQFEDHWRIEEVAQAEDRAVAKFYAAIDEGDLAVFRGAHMDIHGWQEHERPSPAQTMAISIWNPDWAHSAT